MANNDIQQIRLVRREATKRAIMERVVNARPVIDMTTIQLEGSMEDVARVFNVANLDLLAKLRALGHVSLKTAAEKLGYADDEAFVRRVLDGLNLYLVFTPTPAGEPGVRVPFSKLQIDLDFDSIVTTG